MESYAYNNSEYSSSEYNSDRIPATPPRDGALDWNAEIRQDDRYTLLPEGDYVFRVVDVDRETFIGSAKLPPCIQVNLTMQVETPDGPVRIRENLKLCTQMEWLLCSFFRSIGLKEKGKAVVMDWNRVPGARGRFHSKPGTITTSEGKPYDKNFITYLDYDPKIMSQIEAQHSDAREACDDPSFASGFDLKRTSSIATELSRGFGKANGCEACEDEDHGQIDFICIKGH